MLGAILFVIAIVVIFGGLGGGYHTSLKDKTAGYIADQI